MYRNLPPDQQQAVLEAMRNGNGSTGRRDPQLSTQPTTAPATETAPQTPVETGPPRIAAGATLLLDVNVIEQPSPVDQVARDLLNTRRDRIRAGNPYRLDEQGRLTLPTFPPLNLSGLTELQAAQRLSADPRLAGLSFVVTLLPIEPIGIEALKPFGYDVFGEVPTTFAPATDIPVPSDYRVGPGDTVVDGTFGAGGYSRAILATGAKVVAFDRDPTVRRFAAGFPEDRFSLVEARFSEMDAVLGIAKRHGLRVIEDAAHALPTTYHGAPIGTLESDATVFSFYANKTLATGEGGMIVTRDPAIAKRCKLMRLHGIDRDAFDRYTSTKPAWFYEVVAPGYHYNLTDVASCMGIHQLK
jgi:hypothetical protein